MNKFQQRAQRFGLYFIVQQGHFVRTPNELPAYAAGVKKAIEGVKNAKN